MSSLAYEQLLCNSKQDETQELCHDISQSEEQLLCNIKQDETQELCHDISQADGQRLYNCKQEQTQELCHDISQSDKNKSRQNQDERSSQFVFNIWWTVFLTVIVVTLGISVLYQMFSDCLSQALDYTGSTTRTTSAGTRPTSASSPAGISTLIGQYC